ncbi:preprotein translocase subunit SecG [Paenalcaligenes hominis]|uniref:Protein-export membrane protein SecG n=1 Tax=Paenalcaligenes hominis TaxID=643674 RepID=A0ABX0WKL7_9BURK|nr:preprotein translocase subunit SecG [Paenalcaligenes hominis]NJB63789.1 preprotein translocase subunit SecG [Paenalcaligenes hominis]GGE60664.1 preprotein translocase subunit SecG [Paenalcaligenes hominis]
MEWLSPLLQAVQVIASLSIIGLVLLQQGKGAEMGSAFGAGSAGSVFGAAGAANFLSRMTRWAAIVFFIATGALAWVAHHPVRVETENSIMQGYESIVPGSSVAPAQQPNNSISVPEVPEKPSPTTN